MPHLGNRISLLEETLSSHRFAMSLNPSNTDIQFNAAQVMTSLAEAQLEGSTQQAAKHEARPLLEEAVSIFTRCLQSQQQDYTQMQAEIVKAQSSGEYQEAWKGERQPVPEPRDESMDTDSTSSEPPGDWAVVEEPLTPEAILETCIAQLSALTNLLALYDPNVDLSSIEKGVSDGQNTVSTTVPELIELIGQSPGVEPMGGPTSGPTLSIGSTSTAEEETISTQDEAMLTAANFEGSTAEVLYRSNRISSTEYAQTVERIFTTLAKMWETRTKTDLAWINLQSAYADALMDLSSALADSSSNMTSNTQPASTPDPEIQWTALTQAQTILTALSSAPYTTLLSPSRLSTIFTARGDLDLFRFRISTLPSAQPAWSKAQAVLLANAGVFYRGGRSYAERSGDAYKIAQSTADAKAVVAEIMKEGIEERGAEVAVKENWKGKSVLVGNVLGQMVEEGIVGGENVDGVLRFVQ